MLHPPTTRGTSIPEPEREALESIAAIARAVLEKSTVHAQAGALTLEADSAPKPSKVARAKALYAARRYRDRAFAEHASMFSDPVWDIMLDLFIAYHEDRPVSVSSACIAACVAQTTALRWLGSLERRNLIIRTPDFCDKRRHYLGLSSEGLALIDEALTKF